MSKPPPPSVIHPEVETTILGCKANHRFEQKFFKICQTEANVIITAIVLGYLQWRTTLQQAVTIEADDKKDEQKLVDALSAKITGSTDDESDTDSDSKQTAPSEDDITKLLGKKIYIDKNSYLGLLRMQKGGDVLLSHGTQRVFVATVGRWNPKLPKLKKTGIGKHRPWGLADNLKYLPKGLGPLSKAGKGDSHQHDFRQHIVGYVHGACLCFHARELNPDINTIDVLEYPTIKPATNAACLPCALYMSAIGLCPDTIHLKDTPSWIPPNGDNISATEQIVDISLGPSLFQRELFTAFMQVWLKAGMTKLKKVKKKGLKRAKIKLIGKNSDKAALWFVDSLTVQPSITKALAQILSIK